MPSMSMANASMPPELEHGTLYAKFLMEEEGRDEYRP